MDVQLINTFIWGAVAMASAVAGLFFLRFWRDTGERLFACFAAAFWILSLDWSALAVMGPTDETRHYYYLVRLLAFGLIIAGMIEKNRQSR
jgi:hypothetical protein